MKTYIGSNKAVAIFAANTLLRFENDSPSIMIMCRWNYGDCSVSVAINSWSEDIEKTLDSIFSDAVSSTSTVTIPGSTPPQE